MRYLLYLKQSILRRPQRHITLYIILTCAFMLPLLISIYRDSSAYGQEQYLLDISKGETFHITNASKEHLCYFENFPGMSVPFYDDNTIYLKILSEDEWKDQIKVDEYGNEVIKRASFIEDESLIVYAYDYYSAHGISTDPADISGQRVLLIINLFIILLSVFVIQSAYKSHLNNFSSDIGILTACGANHHQIRVIFIMEFLLIFFLAAISSIAMSICIMKLLFWSFLEIRNVPGLAWLIFHVNPGNTTLHLFVFFISMTFILGYTLWQTSKKSAGTLVRSSSRVTSITIRNINFTKFSSPTCTLSRLWRRRSNGILLNCLLISIPVMTIFLFLFNYLMLDINFTSEIGEYEIAISKNILSDGFSVEDINYVQNMEGVKQIQLKRQNIMQDRYMMREFIDESEDMAWILPVNILRYNDLPYDFKTNMGKYDIAVSNIIDGPFFRIGDIIILYRADYNGYSSEIGNGFAQVGEEIELTVAAVLDNDSVDIWDAAIYVGDEFYEELMDSEPVSVIEIALESPDMNSQVEYNLRQRFSGAEYELTNRQSRVDFVEQGSTGIYLLLAYIFCILFLFILIILYVKLCDYIENSRKNIHSLYIIGASKRDLYCSYMHQAFVIAIIAAIMPVIICEILFRLTVAILNISTVMNAITISIYIGVDALILCAYLYPIHRTLKNILQKL